MVVASGRLAPLHIQCIRDCINIENKNLRRKTWIALAKSVSMLLEVSKDLKLLESAFSEEELKEFKQLVESYPPKSTVIDPVVRPGSTNLPEYASIATLPSMPWYPRYAGSPPYKQPNDKRNLRSVQQIPTTKFFKRVLSYQKARPTALESNWFQQSQVPRDACQGPRVPHHDCHKCVESWVREVAMQTALCLLRNTEAGSEGWNFGRSTSRRGGDVVFKSVSETKGVQSEVDRLLVEVENPWTLSLTDMEKITQFNHGLPSLSELRAVDGRRKSSRPGYTSGQQVLSRVYDDCRRQKHRFFIITTYEYWMFGVFSLDYAAAAVTEPLPYDHEGPTILQCITYWLQCSLFFPGFFEISEVFTAPESAGFSDFRATGSVWKGKLPTWRPSNTKALPLELLVTSVSSTAVNVSGHFSDLFRGVHREIGDIALKRLRIAGRGDDADIIRRFEREATTWKRLRHPHVLEFLGTLKRDDHLYLVSPFIKNGTLMDYLHGHAGVSRVKLLHETAEGIHYLHTQDVVHGDIKGTNILISDDARALLCDFGLARPSYLGTSSGLKGAGSDRWMSPELWRGGCKSFESDVYAFGMTIVEVLTGKVPFSHLSIALEIMKAVLERKERPSKDPLSSPEGESYKGAWNIAAACWRTEPSKRIAMAEAIRRFREVGSAI